MSSAELAVAPEREPAPASSTRSASSRPRSYTCSKVTPTSHGSRPRSASAGRRRSGWPATAPPTTRPPTGPMRSGCSPAGRPSATRSRSRLLRRRARHVRLHGTRALAVGTDPRRRRVRAPGTRSRRVRRRLHERHLRPSSRTRPTPCSGCSAGPELAVAATKTYVNQVAALGLLAAHAAGEGESFADGIRATVEVMSHFIRVARAAESRRSRSRSPTRAACSSSAAATEFATAREIALKLLETCRIAAEPLTATDLAHGPVAALDSLFPVWAIASDDANLPAVVEAVERAREAGATIIASGTAADGDPGRASTCSRALRRPPRSSRRSSPIVPGTALRLRARTRARARSGLASRALEGDASALAVVCVVAEQLRVRGEREEVHEDLAQGDLLEDLLRVAVDLLVG